MFQSFKSSVQATICSLHQTRVFIAIQLVVILIQIQERPDLPGLIILKILNRYLSVLNRYHSVLDTPFYLHFSILQNVKFWNGISVIRKTHLTTELVDLLPPFTNVKNSLMSCYWTMQVWGNYSAKSVWFGFVFTLIRGVGLSLCWRNGCVLFVEGFWFWQRHLLNLVFNPFLIALLVSRVSINSLSKLADMFSVY